MENREEGKPIDTSKLPGTCSHALLHTQVMTRTLPHLNSNIVQLLRPSIYVHAANPQGTNVLISVSLFTLNNLFLGVRFLICHRSSNSHKLAKVRCMVQWYWQQQQYSNLL